MHDLQHPSIAAPPSPSRSPLRALLAGPPAVAQDAEPVRILTNWFIQPDQAGYWQAAQDNLGKEGGIKITVLQGGPKIQTIPQVASGQAEFGIGNADDVLLARLRGAPVRAVFAPLDYVPYTLRLSHRPRSRASPTSTAAPSPSTSATPTGSGPRSTTSCKARTTSRSRAT